MPSFSNDRAAGVLLGQAAGDALGAGYEFTTPPPGARIHMKGDGPYGWAPGEWTDDTQMAICIAESAATGYLDPIEVARYFLDWYAGHPPDVGNQTGGALGRAKTPEDLAAAAGAYHRGHPDAAGNGSLMRTGPVALAYPGEPDRIAEAAREISSLTHAHPLCGDACVLWCLAIDRAVADAVFDLKGGFAWIPAERRTYWAERIRRAEAEPPASFTHNGFVVTALQAAWSAIRHTPVPEDEPCRHLADTLVAAVRIGDDTDTVAAIAGALLGARWGSSAVPLEWKSLVHGIPGYDARDLTRLAALAAGHGRPDSHGWPSAPDLVPHYLESNPGRPRVVPLPSDAGVILGNVHAVRQADADVIVSLCRMGSKTLRPDRRHVDVFLVDGDGPDANPNLGFILRDTAETISAWRKAGETVFLHCVNAQSRTPTVGAAYLMRCFGMSPDQALAEVEQALGTRPWNRTFVAALRNMPLREDDITPSEEQLAARGLLPPPWSGGACGLDLQAGVDYRSAYRGTLLGVAVGDALGRPAEKMSPAAIRSRFGELRNFRPWHGWRAGPKGTITDDTQMTMCLAQSIVARGGLDPEDLARRFADWLGYGRGKGAACTEACLNLRAGVPWWQAGVRSAGNGAAMRAAPIGLLHSRSPGGIRRDGALSAVITHADPMAAAGAIAVGFLVAYLLHRPAGSLDTADLMQQLAEILADVLDPGARERRTGADDQPVRLADRLAQVPGLLDLNRDEAFGYLWNGAFVLESLPAALWCFLKSPENAEEAVVLAANGGHDADTVAAMTGAFSGAYLGEEAWPKRWLADLEYAGELQALADGVLALTGPGTPSAGPTEA